MGKHKRKPGRPRKFKLSEIVLHQGQTYVVVAHRLRGTKSEYRVVPLTGGRQRYGRALWKIAAELEAAGEFSATGSLLVYRANEWLDKELDGGRGCRCHCCPHTAIPRGMFSIHTGIMKDVDDG